MARDCGGCRYWSQMVAEANADGVRALCLADGGPHHSKYVRETMVCSSFAKNTAGAVDEPPNYGEGARATYEAQAAMTYPNGKPMFSKDGTLLDDAGNRSIFDDVDE